MAQKVKVPCPKCDGKGVIPQYFYNRKGICFMCWGSGYIMMNVPVGESQDEAYKKLVAKEKPDFKKNPPKVPMPHKDQIKNPKYFPKANSKVEIKAFRKKFNDGEPESPKDIKVDEAKKVSREELDKMTIDELKAFIQKSTDEGKKLRDRQDIWRKRKLDGNIAQHELINALSMLGIPAKQHEDNAAMAKSVLDKLEKEKAAKAAKPAKDSRVGTIVAGTRGKPDIEIIDVIGPHIVGKFENSKNGKTQFTVYPTQQMERGAWQAYQDALKANVGGAYSRYLGKQLFNTDPTEAVRKWHEGGGSPEVKPIEKKPTGELTTYQRNQLKRDALGMIDALYYGPDKDNEQAYHAVIEKIKAMADFKDKQTMITDVEDSIVRLRKRLVDAKEQEKVSAIVNKHGGNQYEMDAATLAKVVDELKALPQSDARDSAIYRYEQQHKYQAQKEQREKELAASKVAGQGIIDKAIADYKAALQKQKDILNYKPSDNIKTDTEVGQAVKAHLDRNEVRTDKDVIEVGKIVMAEYHKNLDKFGGWDKAMEAEQAAFNKFNNEYELYHDDVYLKALVDGTPEERTAAQKKVDDYVAKKEKMAASLTEKRANIKENRAKAYYETMKQVRPMGEKMKLNFGGESTKTKVKAIESHLKYYPKEWVEASNQVPIEIYFTKKDPKKRQNSAHYSDGLETAPYLKPAYKDGKLVQEVKQGLGRLQLNLNSKQWTEIHEMGHRMEHINPRIEDFEKMFYERRTKGSELTWLGGNYAKSEKYRPINDSGNGLDWHNKYMGKEYKYNEDHLKAKQCRPEDVGKYYGFELLTMGIQDIVHGDRYDRKSVVEHDEEMTAFVLGMLTAL